MPKIVALLNPITKKRFETNVPAGKPLNELMNLPAELLIECNGRPYNGEVLDKDDLINIVIPPRGGDTGKDIARTGIILAAQIGATALAGPLGLTTAAGNLTLGGSLFVASVSVGATLAAYKLIEPPTPDVALGQEQVTRLGSLTGSRNRLNPYGTVPRVYGKRKLYPPMSARPYTEIEGNDQYQRLLLVVGGGPLLVKKTGL